MIVVIKIQEKANKTVSSSLLLMDRLREKKVCKVV